MASTRTGNYIQSKCNMKRYRTIEIQEANSMWGPESIQMSELNNLLIKTQTLRANLVVRRLGTLSLLRIKAQNTASLVSLENKIGILSQTLDLGIVALNTVEEAALPLATLLLLDAAQFTLCVLNARLVP